MSQSPNLILSYQSVKLFWPFPDVLARMKTYFARKVFKLLSKKFDTKSIMISQQLTKNLETPGQT